MLDGFALGETTPGPLIIVLVFVDFMASQKNFHWQDLTTSYLDGQLFHLW
jgi:hypothetical protein